MTQLLYKDNTPRWRTASGYKVKHVIATRSKTGAAVLWEEGGPVGEETGQAKIICGRDGERLSPIYKQKHEWYHAAIPIHEGYHVIDCLYSDTLINVDIYEITEIGPYPCPGWNSSVRMKMSKSMLLRNGQDENDLRCNVCGEPITEVEGDAAIHPEGGWLPEYDENRPSVTLKLVASTQAYQHVWDDAPYDTFKWAIKVAVEKATRCIRPGHKTKPIYIVNT